MPTSSPHCRQAFVLKSVMSEELKMGCILIVYFILYSKALSQNSMDLA